jgi:hypothetical protein
MPGEYPHRPVPDAEAPCPVCGAVEYDEYFPTEDWRAGRGRKGTDTFKPSPLIVCRVCGHQEQAGGIIRFKRPDPDEDEAAREARLARVRAERAVKRWYSDTMTLMAVAFPIYAAEGWPARISGILKAEVCETGEPMADVAVGLAAADARHAVATGARDGRVELNARSRILGTREAPSVGCYPR